MNDVRSVVVSLSLSVDEKLADGTTKRKTKSISATAWRSTLGSRFENVARTLDAGGVRHIVEMISDSLALDPMVDVSETASASESVPSLREQLARETLNNPEPSK